MEGEEPVAQNGIVELERKLKLLQQIQQLQVEVNGGNQPNP